MDATPLVDRVAEAVKDCRDGLDRVPTLWPRKDGTVEVWVGGWLSVTRETKATVEAIRAAGLTVAKVEEMDLGDEDCMKMTGFITVSA